FEFGDAPTSGRGGESALRGRVQGDRFYRDIDAKKAEAAFKISFARRSSAFSRLRRLISTAGSVVTPGQSPASTCSRRIQVRIVSGDPLPSSCATAGDA